VTAAFVVLGVVVIIAIPALALIVFIIVRTDLKRKFEQTGQVSFDGRSRSVAIIDLVLPGSHTREAAEVALESVGCRKISVSADWLVGWTRFPITSENPWWSTEPQQVAIQVLTLPDGHARFVCSSQPRFSITWMDMGKSQRTTNKVLAHLQAEE